MADSCVKVLQNTKLAVPAGLCAELAKSVTIRDKEEELEVRFGYTLDEKNYSGLAGSEAESSREMWYRLFKLLQGSALYKKSNVEKTLSETFGSLRKITDISVPLIAPVYHEKKKVKAIDILSFNVGGRSHTVRLNRSTENPRPNTSTKGVPDFARIRTRVAFSSKDGSHRIDMTYAISPQGGKASYEVEIEYLRVLKDSNGRADLKSFFDPIKLVVYIIKGDNDLVTTLEHNQAIQIFNAMFAKEARFDPTKLYKRALPQPVNLKKQVIPRMNAYAVTNKLNGTRMIGVIFGGDLYAINMVGDVIKVLSGIPVTLDKTIFDAEYFKGVLYIFDMLFDKNIDIRAKNLDIRLLAAEALVKVVTSDKVKMKIFRMSGDLEQDTREVLKFNNSLPEEDNDGLIYTPITLPYFNDGIYKWKPPHMLTIDFAAGKVEDGKWTLQVKDKQDKLVTFAPSGFQGVIESKQYLNGIGEYKWNGQTFELVRPRPDKDTPNFITVAQDVWEDIRNPILEEDLPTLFSKSEEGRDGIRKYHNSIKRDLINILSSSEFTKGKVVLDLGAGKGGDLAKYQSAKIKSLFAVEPNNEFSAELQVRAEGMRKKNSLSYSLVVIPTKAQDNLAIAEALKGYKVDAAAMFFSLSFFFENNLALYRLIDTLNETVEKGGMFIGTTIDGETVRRVLENKDEVTFGPVTLSKKYKDFVGPIDFNKAIDYIYKDSETVADVQREYLVDWDLFVKRLEKYGFVLENTDMFKPVNWLSDEENQVTTMYRRFVFRRLDYTGKQNLSDTGNPKMAPKHLVKKNPGDTVVLNSTLVSELKKDGLDYQLVRTGTHGDGNCFFHSVMLAIKGDEYRKLSDNDKKKMVTEYRKKLEVSKNDWMNIWNGNFARIGQYEYPGFDTRFWKFLQDDTSRYLGYRNHIDAALGNYGIVNFLKEISGRVYESMNVTRFIDEIRKVFIRYIKNKDHEEAAIKQLNEIIDKSLDEAYTAFITLIKACGAWVGQEVLDLVSKDLDVDIYILHDINGSPYKTECKHLKGRKSIVLLFQGMSHYECVGRNVKNTPIQRIFDPEDPLIRLIQEEIC